MEPSSVRVASACLASLMSLAAAQVVRADPVNDFYTGKRLVIWVGYGPGGGYDTTTRLVAARLGAYIPGQPVVSVQNVPGAGSLLAANNLYNVAPKDGTVLGVFSSTVAMLPLYRDPNANFDTTKFNWIGNMHRDMQSCAVWKGAGQGIRTLPDLIAAKKPVIFGSDGADAPLTRWPLFMKNVLGANLRVVPGYKGTKEINFAMQTGEAHATCGMFETSLRGSYWNDFKSGDLNIFVQTSYGRNLDLFGDATNIYSLLKTEEEIQMAKLVFGPAEITRPLAAPPGVPQERVTALRKALLAAMKDPGLIADGAKIGLVFLPMSGEEVEAELQDLFKTPRAVVDKASIATSRP
jgi:tripartite-type tricarboxylate transporter receptor subunit TctC